ncbi:MAG: HNH endonuclease [Acidobacteriia bacterium]|nr:HNH endonuclease [Terriglobia bacterium]
MSKYQVPVQTRVAIWRAHGKKCLYCGELINFGELEVDHVIPENLNDNRTELARIQAELELPSEFTLNSIPNLVPAHRRCNLAKTGQMFNPATARFYLEIASRKEVAVLRQLESLKLQDRKERILVILRNALDTGSISLADLSDMQSNTGSFSLSAGLEFFDGSVEGELRKESIDALLDKPVLFGSTRDIDGIEFVNNSGSSMTIRTCREYRVARAAGYYPVTNFALKMQAFLSSADAILDAVTRAQIPSLSYVSNPSVGVADLQLLPKDVLPTIGPDHDRRIEELKESSLQELARAGNLKIVDVSSTRLVFEWEGAGAMLRELLRADLDGDGVEEILVEHYTYAVGGTLGFGGAGTLRRLGPDLMFEYVPSS